MAISKSRIFHIAVALVLALIQLLLMPLLTCEGGGIKAILAEEDSFPLCLAVFLAVLAACHRPTFPRQPGVLWHCAFRAGLWSAVMSLFFFEIWCIGLLRYMETPPNASLHGNAVILFSAILWFVSFSILRVAVRRSAGQPSPT